jgi:hypothetical protein
MKAEDKEGGRLSVFVNHAYKVPKAKKTPET